MEIQNTILGAVSQQYNAPPNTPQSELYFHQFPKEPIDFKGDSEIVIPQNKIEMPVGNEVDGYLFNIHEENGYLFLFMKAFINNHYQTICILVEEPRYYLKFLPVPGYRDDLIEEVRQIAQNSGGKYIEPKNGMSPFQTMSYVFNKDGEQIPRESEWLCASFSSQCNLSQIPRVGRNYSTVFGLTYSLRECFCTNNLIKGPQWVHIRKLTEIDHSATTIPMFRVKNPKFVSILTSLNQENSLERPIPPFNLCSMSLRYIHDSKENKKQIIMISMLIRPDCEIESYNSKTKNCITICNTNHQCPADNVIFCKNEEELIRIFVEKLDEYNIDLLVSYNLQSDLNLIFEKIQTCNPLGWWRIGRIRRGFEPPDVSSSPFFLLSGRVLCNLYNSSNEFIKSVSNSFNSIAQQEFDIYRQPLEYIDILKEIQTPSKLISLIHYNIRDAKIVDKLVKLIQLLPLTIQLSQLSGCPWHRVICGKPSDRCESLFVHTFAELGYIIPEKAFSTSYLTRRDVQYEGGLVLDPQRGFYENCVITLDFNSLYPSIIREYNLCFTTIDEKPIDDQDKIRISQNTVKREPAVLPAIMAELLDARTKVKDLLKNAEKDSLEEKRLQIRQSAIKILANAMYGYLGYPLSRFPAIHIADMVTFLGRQTLNSTVDLIKEKGHNIVYGDTDSVMILTKTKNWNEALNIANEIGDFISSKYQFLKLGVESIFLKFLLLNKKKYAALVYEPKNSQITKKQLTYEEYSKLYSKDQQITPNERDKIKKKLHRSTWLKIKGLEIIRRDWCNLSKYMSKYALEQFIYEETRSKASENIIKELRRISAMLRNDGQPTQNVPSGLKTEITVDDLVINKGLTKPLDQYAPEVKTINVTVARWMVKNGHHVSSNDSIPYVVLDDKSKEPEKRASHPDIVYSVCSADIEWYLSNQFIAPVIRMCEPFGAPSKEMIEDAVGVVAKKSKKKKDFTLNEITHSVLTQLYYSCPLCDSQNLLPLNSKMNEEVLHCCQCKEKLSWKAVANAITKFINDRLCEYARASMRCDCRVITNQLPLSQVHRTRNDKNCSLHMVSEFNNADILKTLTFFQATFTSVKSDNKEIQELCEYMKDYMFSVLNIHGLNRIKFSSLLNVAPFD
ncbi:hypothetical protein TRFO_17877 [Tritrichomonas foetus]|uniref:DNA polymerase n=1 Tax=Tritrichomonas foetus TaxID=1144522 RepID=A0A1J4KM41_9EUKA|nr:hypothetical protein TRFO_17877 [Tritrichomonas foetus]|eukprot:OHT12383.1 hypothetical protein TRFO_17877 [Tritrichomonas foetus]